MSNNSSTLIKYIEVIHMTTLTKNEIKALSYIAADTREETKEWAEETSEIIARDIAFEMQWTEQQVGGLVSSLEQKGVAAIDQYNGDLNWLDGGINTYFNSLES